MNSQENHFVNEQTFGRFRISTSSINKPSTGEFVMKFKKALVYGLVGLFYAVPLWGQINVVTTTTDLKSIAEEVGGSKVKATSLSKGYEDTHHVSPSLKKMSLANQADLYIEIGLDLELWSSKVLVGARNPAIQPGNTGHLIASQGISRLDIPQNISRSQGDIHSSGNPHIWLDPLRAKQIGTNISLRLQRMSPSDKAYFKSRLKAFHNKISTAMYGPKLVQLFGGSILDRLAKRNRLIPFLKKKKISEKLQKKLGVKTLYQLLGGWMKLTSPLRGKKIIFYHKSWIYLANRFSFTIPAYVEEKSGISPSTSHREYLIKLIKSEQIKVIGVGVYYDKSIPLSLGQRTGAKVLVLPVMTGGVGPAKSYVQTIDYILKQLVKAQQN